MAGIAAMVLAGALGSTLGLNDTATFMASCVAFVAVALWTDSRLARRRRKAAQTEEDRRAKEDRASRRPEPGFSLDRKSPKHEGRAG